VLALYFVRRDAPGLAAAESAFRETLGQALDGRLDYDSEYVDVDRFADATFQAAFRAYLRARYTRDPFDLLVAWSPTELDFLKDTPPLVPDVPVLLVATRRVPSGWRATGIVSDIDFSGTLAAALDLQPSAKHVYVVSGSASLDKSLLDLFSAHVDEFVGRTSLTALTGLRLADLKERLGHLPADSIVYYVSLSEDADGQRFAPFAVVKEIAAASTAPVYSWHESALGLGVVGGKLHSSVTDGREMARVALRILGGERVESIPAAEIDSHAYQFDWRELRRWRLDESRLPSGSGVAFRRPSFLEQYRGYVTGGVLLFLAQWLLIGGLLVQRARRKQAEARSSAILRSVPDLMFVLDRDGAYVDYHAQDPTLLYVPPDVFLGHTIREIMPPGLAGMFMDALDQAFRSQEPVVVDYELVIGEARHFEARLVPTGDGRVLSMVRDVTESRRVLELSRTLAGRLIASQEEERQRIARDLHDDLGQKVALLNIEVDRITREVAGRPQQIGLQRITLLAGEIARDLRVLSHALHPSRLEALGLIDSIRSLCSEVSRQGQVNVAFSHVNVSAVVEPSVALCLYRVTQEALNNISKHSRAPEASVKLMREGNELHLQVVDSGVGFEPVSVQQAGLGLASMRERVSVLGGQLAIRSQTGKGTVIDVRVPLTPFGREARSESASA